MESGGLYSSRAMAEKVERTYWLDLFTGATWDEFQKAGGTVSGFRDSRWKVVQQIKSGDYMLCYLTGVSRWVGVLEVTDEPFLDRTPIWNVEDFPCRVAVRPIVALTPETAVPVFDLRDHLSAFRGLKNPNAWTGHFRGSPRRWPREDGETVVEALLAAQRNPVSRPVDPHKLARRPEGLGTVKIGTVTVPDPEEESEPLQVSPPPTPTPRPPPQLAPEATAHDEIQWLLLKLGSDLGMDVWVARNDRGREFDGQRFQNVPRLKGDLPLQFDAATNRTIELIDVLWLHGNAIQAAFEVESTTSIYSGLLRMSDLIAMQPNLNIPLYIVAPDERRNKVIQEVNRPTFSRLSPRMADICRFIAFSTLREKVREVAPVVRYLRPEFVQELSESCDIEEA
jgi:hypothetical protein